MNVLVTGASGFIGSNLCKALSGLGHDVHAFYRPRPNNEIPKLLFGCDLKHHKGDITDFETVKTAARGIDVIFHTAAKLGSKGSPDILYATTVGGTNNVLKAAAINGVQRVIHTSSVAALGVPGWGLPRNTPPQPINEQHSWNFRPDWWPYGYAKHLAELEIQEAVANGLDVVIVNPAVVMGSGDINRIGGEVIFQVASGKFPVSLPGGLNIVHIQDVIKGHLAAMNYGISGERYILAGENIPHLRLHQEIALITNVRKPTHVIPGTPVRALAGIISRVENLLPVS